jgi:hypothetical protein
VAHAGAADERIDDGVDDRGRRADGAGLAGAFDAERIGRRWHHRMPHFFCGHSGCE